MGSKLLVITVGVKEKCAVLVSVASLTINCTSCNRKIVIFSVVELFYLDISLPLISSDCYMFRLCICSLKIFANSILVI
jgi:hypothetical protein